MSRIVCLSETRVSWSKQRKTNQRTSDFALKRNWTGQVLYGIAPVFAALQIQRQWNRFRSWI